MIDLKCSECGCVVPPDATKCPNCGHKYDDVVVKAPAKSNGNDITVSCVGYATKYAVHGKIYIRANIASAPNR
jgi:ribosomal protein L40E